MTRRGFRAVACAVAVWMIIVSASFAQVVINEAHPSPSASGVLEGDDPARLEFLELYNSGVAAVDLSGWSIAAAVKFTFPEGTWLGPDEYLVVARDPGFLQEHGPAIPPDVQVLGWKTGDLSAGVIRLLDASRPSPVPVDALPWPSTVSRPMEENPAGASLELVNPRLHGTSLRAWRASDAINGTPGARNSRFSDAPIVIDEAPARGTSTAELTRISVTFSEAVSHVAASDLTLDGKPAVTVEGTGAGPYIFTVDPPISRRIRVALRGSAFGNRAGFAFGGDSWEYLSPLATVLSMPDNATGGPGATVQVPISAVPADGILGIDMTLQYDPAVILATNVTVSGIAAAAGFAMVRNLNTPGTIIISMYATQSALSGSGEIARITFSVVGSPGATSALTFVHASINEGGIPVSLDPGLFTVTCVGAPNGTSCNDGNACTTNDQCVSGACTGTPVQAPGEIANLGLQADKATLVWDPAAGGVVETAYDVVRGAIAAHPVGPGGGDEVCFADGIAGTTVTDSAIPAVGGGFWYLVRGENSCGKGTYGFEVRNGFPPVARVTTTCP